MQHIVTSNFTTSVTQELSSTITPHTQMTPIIVLLLDQARLRVNIRSYCRTIAHGNNVDFPTGRQTCMIQTKYFAPKVSPRPLWHDYSSHHCPYIITYSYNFLPINACTYNIQQRMISAQRR